MFFDRDAEHLTGAGTVDDVKETAEETEVEKWYRVRKTWADAKSQKGAYKVLKNAKACADKNEGYSVFDWNGEVVYTPSKTSEPEQKKVSYRVRVSIKNLNIRKGPGTNYASYVDGSIDMTTFLLFGIGAVIILILMAMVFRNVHLIFKKSENGTPFQKDNIRMLKEIGIFSITVPVIGLVMSVIIRLVIGVDAVEININQSGLFMGIIVLCLTQYFIYGAELEKDVDGLL